MLKKLLGIDMKKSLGNSVMKKLCSFLLISLFTLSAYAGNGGSLWGGMSNPMWGSMHGRINETVLEKIARHIPGLTFYKNFTNPNQSSLNADFSLGSPNCTYTVARDATHPETYVDENGIIQVSTTADVPLRWGGYYDTTGFHQLPARQRGVGMWASATNLCKDSYFLDGTVTYWAAIASATITNSSTYANPYGGGTVLKIVGNTNDGLMCSVAAKPSYTDTLTYSESVLIRGTGKVKLRIQIGGSAAVLGPEITLANDQWYYYQAPLIANETNTGRVGLIITADSTTVYLSTIQLELAPYATSFIPTTTAALTRNAPTLKYLNAGNRTSAQESIFIKFMPMGGSFANDNIIRALLDCDGDRRLLRKQTTGTVIRCLPNGIGGTGRDATTTSLINTSYVGGFFTQAVGNPNIKVYLNGSQEGTNENTDYAVNTFGSYFFLGESNASAFQLNGIFSNFAAFNRVLTASEVLQVTNTIQ